ncbi:MAG: NTP transferase domain-containing protein [Candidatus Acetothermia bacterium]|jgi:bifunctional UDP-N-acetylglucosamine pyrophosphorylase/glucosamine-1-phosphate N-acetyltransferase|nr:NTP transferase domain-containing protein [Candidatus Acetothermia bacterium]MDH7506106.1 NTP transferase domain-containing protein [Candidatus Acetothermia bacterium]
MGGELSLLILAAGKGKRLLSQRVKVLHELCGQPVLEYVLQAADPLKPQRTLVIVGHQGEQVRERFAGRGLVFIEQREQLGTGHAALQARSALEGKGGEILILPGDLPLLRAELLEEFLAFHKAHGGRLSLLTMEPEDPAGYGRIVRDREGNLGRIVEEKDASEQERQIREVNSGVYLVRNDGLFWEALQGLGVANAQGEYYLSDIVSFYRGQGQPVRALLAGESESLLGVNSRADLVRAEGALRRRKLAAVLAAGARVIAPETVLIDQEVILEPDARVGPGTSLKGRSRIGRGAVVENSLVEGFEVGGGCGIIGSTLCFKEEHGPEADRGQR